MKAPFEYDRAAAVALCKQYSEDPDTLDALLTRLSIEVGPATVIPSPWNDSPRPLKALHMLATVNGFTFPYYGSHNAAEAFAAPLRLMRWTHAEKMQVRKLKDARRKFRDGLLYSLLCCIASDYQAGQYDPEDMGLNPDSIRDMAKWNEWKEHARKLRAALKLTPAELASLPS